MAEYYGGGRRLAFRTASQAASRSCSCGRAELTRSSLRRWALRRLHCAGIAGQRGLKVLLIDHADLVAEKIRISGGGRCNFTNIDTGPANFLSANPHFCRSALARYTPQDFVDLVQRHRIAWHEKHKGQLFCDDSAEDIIAMLLR